MTVFDRHSVRFANRFSGKNGQKGRRCAVERRQSKGKTIAETLAKYWGGRQSDYESEEKQDFFHRLKFEDGLIEWLKKSDDEVLNFAIAVR